MDLVKVLSEQQLKSDLPALKIGDTVKVVKLHGEGAVKRRIMDMGLTKGVDVSVRKVAPLGDPIEITLALTRRLPFAASLTA